MGRFVIAPLSHDPQFRSEIKLLIADERKLFRQGLIALFTKEPGILVVGDSGDGVETFELVMNKNPDVVLLNIRLPLLDGLGVARRLRKKTETPEFIFMANSHNEQMMREVFALGGRAYLLQDCDFREMVFAIKKASMGDFYLTGPAGREMVDEYLSPTLGEDVEYGKISHREKELAVLLADGYSTKEAAGYLNISIKTAENHRAAIMKKIKAKNVTDIVKFCIRNNLIKI
ncbi:MAG: response regulator transcription factor [Candidatus Zixiibacteriota bacterium]